MAKIALNGADEFVLNRDPIRGELLNLGSWFGFQKVLLREQFDPASIEFDFELSEKGYLSLILGESLNGFSGVRLSINPSRPTGLFEAKPDGTVTRFVRIASSLPSETRLKARIEREGQRLILRVNGLPLHPGIELPNWRGRIGFWGGYWPAFAGNLSIRLSSGHEYRASYKTQGSLLSEICLAATLVTLLCLASAWVASDRRSRLLTACATGLHLSICLLVWLGFDQLYWSRLPLPAWTHGLGGEQPSDVASKLERARIRVFQWPARILGDPSPSHEGLKAQGYPLDRIYHGPIFCEGSNPCRHLEGSSLPLVLKSPKKGPRMIFSGSSQTIGVGASTLENTAFSLVATTLAKRRPGLESLNIAQSGGQIVRQYEDYERLYLKFNPDLVVLNWSTNDPPNALRVGIQGFLETNKRLGIRTLLVAEANAVESGTPIREKHRILREMAKHYQVPLLDSHALFEERDKPTNDFVWWDQVHLTDQGQTWLAEFLEPAVLGLLPH